MDAKALGSNSGLYGGDVYSDPVNIGFTFPFYENSYTQLYFSTKGMVTFGSGSSYWYSPRLPLATLPNNFIAALWGNFGMYKDIRPNSGIYVYQGGLAPNRFMVIEWYRLNDDYPAGGSQDLTFEITLHENGDIVTQYQTLITTNATSPIVGIEDSLGMDGMQYQYGSTISSLVGKAIRFYRPTNMARVKAYPLYQGKFTSVGEKVSFPLTVTNTGSLGVDTYDFIPISSWPLSIYDNSGLLLTDTNNNGLVDTGPIGQSTMKAIDVKVTSPAIASVGDNNVATITIRSSNDSNKSKIAELRSTVPAPFAQVYSDESENAMSLYLVKPDQQILKQAGVFIYGQDLTVAEAPNGNLIYAWSDNRCVDLPHLICVNEIFYAIFDHNGNLLLPVGKLVDHSSVSMPTYDQVLSVAVDPSGNIGFAWIRTVFNGYINQSNYNVYFAALDFSGSLVFDPINLTNNNAFRGEETMGVPEFFDTRLVATSDNTFFLSWQRESEDILGSLQDIYYTVRDQNGIQVKPISKFTDGTAGNDIIFPGGLASLASGLVWMGWGQIVNGIYSTNYVIFDSSGNLVKPSTSLGIGYSSDIDAVQLSDGRVLVGMLTTGIYFAILDSTTYDILINPTRMQTPSGVLRCYSISVSADQSGHGILICVGIDYLGVNPYLIYALVDSNGSTLTSPMIFIEAAQATEPYLDTSYLGYGNTAYSIPPSTPNVDTFVTSSALIMVPPSGNQRIGVNFGNSGATTATSIVVKANLDPSLTYLSDTSGISPSVNGNEYTWTFPQSMPFMSKGYFEIVVGVPGAAPGTQYPVTLTISSFSAEANPADNTYNLVIMVIQKIFLPAVSH